jgi:putative membrane protein
VATEISTKPLDANTMAKQRTDWAGIRTRLASERTLMAATRTSLSLIGFGFTIYTFFESFRKAVGYAGAVRENSPRRMGLTLVSLGVFVLIAFAMRHWLFLKKLEKESDHHFPWSMSLTAAGGLAVTGIVVFISIVLRA